MKKVFVHFNVPGFTTKQFDKCWEDLRKAGITTPKGLIHHAAAVNGNNLMVTDIWESEAAFSKFGETLMPILAKNGITNAKPTILPLHFELSAATGQSR